MAITLTTSPQIVGRNEASTIRSYLYAWYDGQSGNSCTVHTRLTVISAGITYTGTNKAYFMNLGGYGSGVVQWGYAPLNANQEYTVAEATWSYSGGEQVSASAGFWSYVYGSADISLSDSVYVPVFNSAPTGLSISLIQVEDEGAQFNVSIDSYGKPDGVNGRYIEAAILGQNTYGGNYRYSTASNTKSSRIRVANDSSSGSLTIRPNTRYWYGCYASNTAMSSSKVQGQFVTGPSRPALQFIEATDTTATLSYSVPADGGVYTKYIEYNLSGESNWYTVDTLTSGAATTGTFVISGLLSGTSYTVMLRTRTLAAAASAPDAVSFDTLTSGADNENLLYGSDDGVAKRITRLYGSANGEAQQITKLYGRAINPDFFEGTIVPNPTEYWAVNQFDADIFNEKMKTDQRVLWGNRSQFDRLEIAGLAGSSPRTYLLNMIYKNGGKVFIASSGEEMLNSYGIFVRDLSSSSFETIDYIDLSYQVGTRLVFRAVKRIDYS